MNRVELSDRFAEMWKKSREDAGKSQDYMAKALGVSKKTIQNWESGFSSPSLQTGIEWFDILGLQPLPYYLGLLYGEIGDISPKNSDEEIETALITLIKSFSPSEKRKLLFIIDGKHGSSTAGIIEMICAHLHVPLKDRLNVCQNIMANYEIADAHGTIVRKENIQPSMEILQQAYENAKTSVKCHKDSYTLTKGIINAN